MRRIFKELTSVDEAINIIGQALKKILHKTIEVDIKNSVGMMLAEDVVAKIDIPPFSRSLRDGYAVKYEDVSIARENMPVKLNVVGSSTVGKTTRKYIKEGEAVEIDTGAMIPGGANAVVMEEYTERKDGEILVYKSVGPNENIQQIGADAFRGEVLLHKYSVITPREIGVLAALGYNKIKVFYKPKFAVISIGDELDRPGKKLRPAHIYDVNGPMITSAIRDLGFKANYLGIIKDDANELINAILKALDKYEIIITSGSTSVGTRDLLFNILKDMRGCEILFYGVRQRPGRPTIAATINDKLFIGLPGFPVSSLMVFYNIVYPAIKNALNIMEKLPTITAILGRDVKGDIGYINLQPVILRKEKDHVFAYPITTGSGAIITLRLADGYITIPEERLELEKGREVNVQLFGKHIKACDLIILGSHSIALNMVLNAFIDEHRYNIKKIWIGSSGVFDALKENMADLGGIHLLDNKTGEYNIPYILKYNVKDVILYRGFRRQVGFVVAKGNPYNIKDIGDIFERKLKFINRASGTGTRILIDILFKDYSQRAGLSFDKIIKKISGYTLEAKTHDAVVTYVEMGLADVGVSVKPAVIGRNVDFIPIKWEYYDILVSKNSNLKEPVKKFLDFLFGPGVKILNKIDGIKIDKNYGNIIFEN